MSDNAAKQAPSDPVAEPAPDPIAEVTNVSFSYSDAYGLPPVLENVSLRVDAGTFLGLIGPNGGGKTTLLKAVIGLLKPYRGTIEFRKDLRGKKKPIGYLPQVKHIDRKFPITVFDVVRSGSIMEGAAKSKTIIKEKVEQL